MQEKSFRNSGNLEALQMSFSFAHCPTVHQKTQESSACESLPRRRHSHHRLRDLSQRRPFWHRALERAHFFECNSDFCKSQAPGASGLQKCDVRHFVQNAEKSSTDLKFHRDHVHANRINMNSFFVFQFSKDLFPLCHSKEVTSQLVAMGFSQDCLVWLQSVLPLNV